jgi:hypothetical protein
MNEPHPAPGWLVTIAQFTAWLVTSLVAVVDALYIREAILAVLQALQIVNYNVLHKQGFMGLNYQFGFAIGAADNVMLLILGIAMVGFTVWVEYYFRRGRLRGLLWKRIGLVFGGQIALIVVMILIMALAGLA